MFCLPKTAWPPTCRLIHNMKESHIGINRKMLADLAVRDPQVFAAVVAKAQSAQS